MANYSENLLNGLIKRDVSVKVVTSHCACKYKYRGSSALFGGKYSLVTAPFDSFADKPDRSRIQSVFYRASRTPLGVLYAKQCRGSDILHYQQSSIYSFGELSLLTLLPRSKAPCKVVTIHNLYIDRLFRRGTPLRLLPRVYQCANAIIVHSNRQKDRMMQVGIQEDKIHVIFHGSQNVTLEGLARTRITFFGSPQEFKGFFTLLKALRILRDEGIKVNLEVYGIYGKEDEEIAKNEARRNNVENQVKWYGWLSELEFDEKMQESLFTFAIPTEPVWGSNIIAQAMMNGTPVIATPIGGSSEYLGDAGVYVSANDPASLASAIRDLLENRRLREDLGKMVRQRALQYLSWDAIAEKTIQIYQSALNT